MKKSFSTWCGSLAAAFACAWSGVAAAFGAEPFLTAWGMDADGQASPTDAAVVCGGASAIAAGYHHSLAVVDSCVYAWGAEEEADGRCTVPPAGRTNVVAVAAGRKFSVALRNDATVVSWGLFDTDEPTTGSDKLSGDITNDVRQVAAGERHVLVLKNDGRVVATGYSGIADDFEVPVDAQSGVSQVAAGEYFSLALKDDHTIVAWGDAATDLDVGVLQVPASLQGHAAKIAAGHYHALAITDTGDVVEWGWTGSRKVPDGARTGATDIAGGYDFSVAIAGGTVYAWGNGDCGQLDLPASLSAGASAIAAGWGHCLALGPGMAPHWLEDNVPDEAFVARDYSGSVSATGMPAVVYAKGGTAWPAWLKLNPDTGALYGRPATTSGVVSITILATNIYGAVSNTFGVRVGDTPLDPPVFITERNLPDGEMGWPYQCPIRASNAAGYYLADGGVLPLGLALSEDGTLSGVPAAEDEAVFYVMASNATATVTKEFYIRITASSAAPEIRTGSPLPPATLGDPYSLQFETDRAATFSQTGGTLPAGLGLEPAGVLSGTPSAVGSYSFTIQAANGVGTNSAVFALDVNAAPAITTETLPSGSIGTAYSQTIAATGWPVPTFTLASGSLPSGLGLGADGTISGKPGVSGTFPFSVTASNTVGTATRAYSLTIDSVQRPQFTSMTFSNKTVTLEWMTPKAGGTYLYWNKDLTTTNWTPLGRKTSPWTGPQTNSTPVYFQLRIR